MKSQEDIEIYIEGNETDKIVSFLNKEIGTLSFDSEIDKGHILYTYSDAKILINSGIQYGYISVYLKGLENWKSDIEFARCIVSALEVTVRCDPGSEYPTVSPYSNIFVEISQQGENLVEWG
ncbi:MAG: hypothetical protein H6975_04230 [Gammaproteobacteria bacterium]|nr:hypothetical protein [Gammaproteobacteria bacterium]